MKDGIVSRPCDPKSGNLQTALDVLTQGGFANNRRKIRWQNKGIVGPKRKDTFNVAAFRSSENLFRVALEQACFFRVDVRFPTHSSIHVRTSQT